MTTLTVEQILAANKTAAVEAQALAATAFAGFEKLVALNVATTKSALFETADFTSVFSAKNPTDALAAQASLVKPLAEKSIAYGKSVYAIASETSAEFAAAAEGKFAEAQKTATAALDNLAKKAVEVAEKQANALTDNVLSTVKTNSRKK